MTKGQRVLDEVVRYFSLNLNTKIQATRALADFSGQLRTDAPIRPICLKWTIMGAVANFKKL